MDSECRWGVVRPLFYLMSIHKWPFLHWAVFSAGFRLRRTYSTPCRKPLCGLAQRKKISFLNRTFCNAFYDLWMNISFLYYLCKAAER